MSEFLETNSIYVVLIVAFVVLAGPLAYLAAIDRRVRRLEENESE